MYGSHAYNIRSELGRAKSIVIKFFLTLIIMLILLFILRQLLDVPIEFLNYTATSITDFRNVNSSIGSGFDWKGAFIRNPLIQSVTIFLTGISGVTVRFFNEIKEMLQNI